MPAVTTETAPITRAAERYLEQYGEPMVMNTYLKVTVLVLAAVALMLGALLYKSQTALTHLRPLIIRVSDVGHAEAINYRNYAYRPQEAENKYYLARWASLFFQRNRYTIESDQTAALYFFANDVQHAVIRDEQEHKTIATFQHDPTLPYVDVDVKSIVLDGLEKTPYSARIEFEKVYTNPADHNVLKRERWIASATYQFAETVANEAVAMNPLGLTILRFRADQAFE